MPADTDWSDANIIVGTLGNSKAIDLLAEMGAIDVSEIEDKSESFTVQENGGNTSLLPVRINAVRFTACV